MGDAIGRDPGAVYTFLYRNGLTPKQATRGRKKGYSPGKKEKKKHIYEPRTKKIIGFFDEGTESQKLIERPPAVYGNSSSPYGIATELHNQF